MLAQFAGGWVDLKDPESKGFRHWRTMIGHGSPSQPLRVSVSPSLYYSYCEQSPIHLASPKVPVTRQPPSWFWHGQLSFFTTHQPPRRGQKSMSFWEGL